MQSEAGSAAMLREAIDPANRSLQDALRLSYRVLQIVMLVLVVVFVFSGVKQVGEAGYAVRFTGESHDITHPQALSDPQGGKLGGCLVEESHARQVLL